MRSLLLVVAASQAAALLTSPGLRRPAVGAALVAMQTSPVGGEDDALKRAESGKAALVSLLSGTIAATPFLVIGPGAFTSPSWEFQADGLAIMLFLFGVVYRYAVRTDENPVLTSAYSNSG